jgi:hypothetical protein
MEALIPAADEDTARRGKHKRARSPPGCPRQHIRGRRRGAGDPGNAPLCSSAMWPLVLREPVGPVAERDGPRRHPVGMRTRCDRCETRRACSLRGEGPRHPGDRCREQRGPGSVLPPEQPRRAEAPVATEAEACSVPVIEGPEAWWIRSRRSTSLLRQSEADAAGRKDPTPPATAVRATVERNGACRSREDTAGSRQSGLVGARGRSWRGSQGRRSRLRVNRGATPRGGSARAFRRPGG